MGVGCGDAVEAIGGIDHVKGVCARADSAQPVVFQHSQRAHPDIYPVGGRGVGQIPDAGKAVDNGIRQEEPKRRQSHRRQQDEPGVEQDKKHRPGEE